MLVGNAAAMLDMAHVREHFAQHDLGSADLCARHADTPERAVLQAPQQRRAADTIAHDLRRPARIGLRDFGSHVPSSVARPRQRQKPRGHRKRRWVVARIVCTRLRPLVFARFARLAAVAGSREQELVHGLPFTAVLARLRSATEPGMIWTAHVNLCPFFGGSLVRCQLPQP